MFEHVTCHEYCPPAVDGSWSGDRCEVVKLGDSPVPYLLTVGKAVWAACGDSIHRLTREDGQSQDADTPGTDTPGDTETATSHRVVCHTTATVSYY